MKRFFRFSLVLAALFAGCAGAAIMGDEDGGEGTDLNVSTMVPCPGKDVANDPANCGGCDKVCALPNVEMNVCHGGQCAVGGCAAGSFDVDGNAANGCECQPMPTGAMDQKDCNSAYEVGDVDSSPPSKLEVDGNLVPLGDEDWYLIRARDVPVADGTCDPFDVKISFSENPGDAARFDVYDDCATPTGCAGDGEVPTGLTAYEWNSNGVLPDAGCPCYAANPPPDGGHLCTDESRLLRIRVFHTMGKPLTCDNYKLLITNGI